MKQPDAPPYVARLATNASPHEQSTAVKTVTAADDAPGEPEEDAVVATPPSLEDGPPTGYDEAAESAFRAEAKERGETVPTGRKADAEPAEEADPKSLPKLDELVGRIPAEVRDVLDDLFRAKFVSVKRIPKKALKSATEEK